MAECDCGARPDKWGVTTHPKTCAEVAWMSEPIVFPSEIKNHGFISDPGDRALDEVRSLRAKIEELELRLEAVEFNGREGLLA